MITHLKIVLGIFVGFGVGALMVADAHAQAAPPVYESERMLGPTSADATGIRRALSVVHSQPSTARAKWTCYRLASSSGDTGFRTEVTTSSPSFHAKAFWGHLAV